MEKSIAVGQARVAYLVEGADNGSGEGVLLIHGTGGSAEGTWKELTESLSGRHKVVAPNYSGSGNTTDNGGPLRLEDLAEQNVQAARAEGLDRYHVVGYSLGAVIAGAIAANYPDRVKSVTMIGGWVETDITAALQFHFWEQLLQVNRHLFAQYVVQTGFSPDFYGRYSRLDELLGLASVLAAGYAPGMDRQSELNTRINIRPLIGSITARALVIGLTYDRMVPVHNAKELASLIQGAKYKELATGHLVRFENMEAYVREIVGFIES